MTSRNNANFMRPKWNNEDDDDADDYDDDDDNGNHCGDDDDCGRGISPNTF